MTYIRELDDLKHEVRKDIAQTISFFPKLDGDNVTAEPSSPAPSFELFSPEGQSIQGATACAIVSFAGVGDRLDCLIPALTDLKEDYQARITWARAGESLERLSVVPFDVVLYPLEGRVSFQELQEDQPDIKFTLERLGNLLGLTEREAAAMYIDRALVELDALIRQQVHERDLLRPYLILNRQVLSRPHRLLALKLVYLADSTDPESTEDESAGKYREYRTRAEAAWRSIGPLKLDSSHNQDLVVDSVAKDVGRSVSLRRVQG